MQRVYVNTTIFIILVTIGIQWGFYHTYTSEFPHFKDKTMVIHIHGALLMLWLVLLMVQPILIKTGRYQLHRTIGRSSWVLGPLIVLFLFLIGQGAFRRDIGVIPEHDVLMPMALDIRGFLSFAIFWALAMINRKPPNTHMRYMIATGILGIGPGIGRGLMHSFDVSFWNALTITDLIGLLIVAILLVNDIYRKKNYKPFLVVFIVLLIGSFMWQIRDTDAWQSFARTYAQLFYQSELLASLIFV